MRLSIVIPVYNERATIIELLDRVAAVDLDTEVIVVDDGSTDWTGRVVKVASTMACTFAGLSCFRRPGLEASRSTPGTPLVTNRRAHKRTVIRLTCSVRATAEGDSWCDSIHTSRARRAIFWGVVPWRATRANWACSVGDAKTQYR